MDTKSLKLELLQYIIQTESKELLNKLLTTVKKEESDFWVKLTAEQQEEFAIARKQIESDETEDWQSVYERLIRTTS